MLSIINRSIHYAPEMDIGVAAIAPWIHLCHLGFESQAQHQGFFKLYLN